MKQSVCWLIIVAGLVFISACQTATPSPSAAPISTATATTTVVPTTALPTNTNTPIPVPSATPLPTATPQPGQETQQSLRQAHLPIRNPEDLAQRFKGAVANDLQPGKNYALGNVETFSVLDSGSDPPSQFELTAELQYITDHSYWWVEKGFSVSKKDLQASAQQFEAHTYPTNRNFFGSEASPGVDDDVRIHVLLGNIPGVAGYFYSANQYHQWAVETSNQHEMFIINLNAIKPGNDRFDGVIAHEFQHMIHWNQDPNEDAWINEGLSELAEFVNGYGISGFSASYLQKPDIQLTSWSSQPDIRNANYGASFLFSLYLYNRFGPQAIKALVANTDNGSVGVEQSLQKLGFNGSFDELFADFIIANYLNNPSLQDGRWGYSLLNEALPAVKFAETISSFPAEINGPVHQYGVDYLKLNNIEEALTISFTGALTVPLLKTSPHSDSRMWYSNRADTLDATLTRSFDLTNLSEATLEFWAWYDIEPDWDYAYVTVSTDGGRRWDVLPGAHTVSSNPSGNAYGPGYTGKSGGDASWIKETVDLSPYAGQKILLRFEYITDDAVNQPGFAIDDIAIPQLNYFHTVEEGPDNWQANGFILTDNVLPQKYILQLIQFAGEDEPTVEQATFNQQNEAFLKLPPQSQAVLIISAQAPVTTIPARYNLKISPEEP